MAWNRPTEDGRANTPGSPRRGRSPRPTVVRGVIAGLIVSACAAVAAWLILSGSDDAPAQGTKHRAHGTIREVTPAAAPKAKEEPKAAEKPYADLSNDEKLKYWHDRYGDNPPENLKAEIYFLKHPPAANFRPLPSPQDIFTRHSEREIAALLLVEPGAAMLRTPTYDERFDRDFAASLAEKIEFSKDDTEFQRDLKQAVIDAKKDLAVAVGGGQRASDAMNEYAKQLYELGEYRENIADQVYAIIKGKKPTDDDVKDCIDAANLMLKDKGIAPLKQPGMMLNHLLLNRDKKGNAE